MVETDFQLAGAEMGWPIGSAPGLTNHPDIEVVARRLEDLAGSGVSFAVGGSWTLGDERGGNGYVKVEDSWDYVGGDEYVDLAKGAGYNSKRLPGPGTDRGMPRVPDLVDITASHGVEFALSLSPHGGKPLEELKEIVSLAGRALAQNVLYVEINLSCPNVPNRPAFYLDEEGVLKFYEHLDEQDILLNKYGHPGLYLKYGPFAGPAFNPSTHMGGLRTRYGRVMSNTLGNQIPQLPNGEDAVKVNGGKAGMSGPALREMGRDQLQMWADARERLETSGQQTEFVRSLGVDSGQEVRASLDIGATAVQLGSVLYWPELRSWESAGEAVETIKQEFLEASEAA